MLQFEKTVAQCNVHSILMSDRPCSFGALFYSAESARLHCVVGCLSTASYINSLIIYCQSLKKLSVLVAIVV